MTRNITFAPRKRGRYAVLENGRPLQVKGRNLIVKAGSVDSKRNQLLNAGRTPPPPLPRRLTAIGTYNQRRDETSYACPSCRLSQKRRGNFTGMVFCGSVMCGTEFKVMTPEPAPLPQVVASFVSQEFGEFDFVCPHCGKTNGRARSLPCDTHCFWCGTRYRVVAPEPDPSETKAWKPGDMLLPENLHEQQ